MTFCVFMMNCIVKNCAPLLLGQPPQALEKMGKVEEERAWELIGWRKLEEQFSQPIVQFMQDIGNFRDCTIFDTVGNERSAEPQECVGLERSAVWEEMGVEDRLLDAFMGRPNASVERLKVRLK